VTSDKLGNNFRTSKIGLERISWNFISRKYFLIFVKVCAKTKIRTLTVIPHACACGVIFLKHNITFWEEMKNICLVMLEFSCHRLKMKICVFAFSWKCSFFRENFFAKIYKNSRNINYVNYLGKRGIRLNYVYSSRHFKKFNIKIWHKMCPEK
jgi:hypothetical protein